MVDREKCELEIYPVKCRGRSMMRWQDGWDLVVTKSGGEVRITIRLKSGKHVSRTIPAK